MELEIHSEYPANILTDDEMPYDKLSLMDGYINYLS